MDIIFVGQQAWDTDIGSNAINIAEIFSQQHRVLYVNAPLDRKTQYAKRHTTAVQKRLAVIKGEIPGIEKVGHQLWVLYPDVLIESINWIPFSHLFDFFNKINNRRFFKSIAKAMKSLGFKADLLFNDNDMFRAFYLPDFLQPTISIYYSRDNMLAVPYWAKHGRRIEPLLMQKSTLCLANSTYLANLCKQYNDFSFYVGQGCDLTLFDPLQHANMPNEMASLPAPVIGYVGALVSLRLDIALLEQLAKLCPEWQFVFVGPEDEMFQSSLLHRYENVRFLGSKTMPQLPAYIQSFDVCLNPQKINEVTIGNYPRKIDEYLAMGKPVVATATPFMKEVFGDVVYLADSAEGFKSQIAKALNENNKDLGNKRIQLAHSHSWDNCVKEIYKQINAFFEIVPKQLP